MECQKKHIIAWGHAHFFHKHGKHAEVTPPRYGGVGDIPH